MSVSVAIRDRVLAPLDRGVLHGRNLEGPQPGADVAGGALRIVGWLLPVAAPAERVEIASGAEIVAVAPLEVPRPDLTTAFPDVAWAETAGFAARVALIGEREVTLDVRGVLADGRRVELGAVRAQRTWESTAAARVLDLVSVVVTVCEPGSDLAGALATVAAQTYPHVEIVVVDGLGDGTAELAAQRFVGARVVSAVRRGLAALRNRGLAEARGSAVVFLDAGQELLPRAIEAGLEQLAAQPRWAFAAGLTRIVGADPFADEYPQQPVLTEGSYEELLRGNHIASLASIVFRREAFERWGTFDETLPALSDYDLYLRIARHQPAGSHVERVVADPWPARPRSPEALETARRLIARELARGDAAPGARLAAELGLARLGAPGVEAPLAAPEVGKLDLGDLGRHVPLCSNFGYGRGTPVDRYYIEGFLESHAGDVRGRVLEIQDRDYTERFGGSRVTRSDVLSLTAENPRATLVGDLSQPGTLPSEAFDCVILTQTLHLVYDFRTALEEVHRALRPEGVLLVTTPGISQVEWGEAWHWSFTTLSLRRLLQELFGRAHVAVESFGNVLAATAFLHGIALEELDREQLDYRDLCFPVIVAARACRVAPSA